MGSDFFRLVGERSAAFEALPPHLHETLVRGYVTTAMHRPPREDVLVRPWLGERGQPAFCRQISQADERFTREFEDRFADLACPTLVVWGREDRWLPVEYASRLAGAIPTRGCAWWTGRVTSSRRTPGTAHRSARRAER